MILFAIFCLVNFIQIFYYLFIFKSLKNCNSSGDPTFSSPVSVVVCARNEENNLKVLLPALISQKYTSFELVLVNDNSQDASLKFMLGFQSEQEKNYNPIKIKVINLSESESSGKKNALTRGILNASHENILLTDADCVPASDYWLKGMTAKLTGEKTIALGYGAYNKINGSFLNRLIRYETMLTAMQYFSYAKMGRPYMGVGRNLAYKKKVFLGANGFKDHAEIASGDDDLYITQVASANNTALCIEKGAFTYSQPKTSLASWIRQKRRHITTSGRYKRFHQIALGMYFLSQILFWVLIPFLFIKENYVLFVLFLVVIRFIIWYYRIISAAKNLMEQDLILIAPVMEICLICVQLTIFIANIFSPPKKW